MAKYLILIYGNEQRWGDMTEEQQPAHDAAHRAFAAAAGERILAAEQLEFTSMATTLRTNQGKLVTTDGPFLEAKEAVGGFYLIEAADLDEVIALASKLPEVLADHSGVEIRPIVNND
jgi:hypothetical protein